jgi:DNA-binding IclR family transcriptional regulator
MAGSSRADRILAILDVFTEDRLEWTPEELMAQLGYSRPTLYRYLKSLRESGLLTSLPNAGFTLGPRVVEMDFLMRKSDVLVQNGRTHLVALSSRYPCSAQLVRWYGEKSLCVASECSTPNPISSYPRGRPMPLSRGAISRAIMANLPRHQLLKFVQTHATELSEVGLGQTIEEVLEALRGVRRAGVAVAYGEVTPGVVGVAAPIFDAGRTPIATLSITISAQDSTAKTLDAICHDVRTASQAVTANLEHKRGAEVDQLFPRRRTTPKITTHRQRI